MKKTELRRNENERKQRKIGKKRKKTQREREGRKQT